MSALDSAGVTPEWVQVGNEITSGMLFPDGSTNNWSQLAQLLNKGYDAVKAKSPTTKVVLHIDQGNNNSRFRYWFDNAKTYGAKYDVIGLSYYPYWLNGSPDYTLSIAALGSNLLDMASRYGKEVMIVETGGLDTKAQNTKDMLIAEINKVMAVPNKAGLGVIYWEPQASRNWGQYPLSAWTTGATPQPTIAMDAFLTETNVVSSITTTPLKMTHNVQNQTLDFNATLDTIDVIDLNGVVKKTVTHSSSISLNNLPASVYLIQAHVPNASSSLAFKCIHK
jgi:arabinogalactan endo-1,4-beta-galactosidase